MALPCALQNSAPRRPFSLPPLQLQLLFPIPPPSSSSSSISAYQIRMNSTTPSAGAGSRLPQKHAWVIDEVSKSGLPRANRQTISRDRSFVAWPGRLHRHSSSTNRYCLQTRTTTLVALYHLALSAPGKGWSARVSKEVVSGPEAIAVDPEMPTPRRIVLESIQTGLMGSWAPWGAVSVTTDGPLASIFVSLSETRPHVRKIWRCDMPILSSHPSSHSPGVQIVFHETHLSRTSFCSWWLKQFKTGRLGGHGPTSQCLDRDFYAPRVAGQRQPRSRGQPELLAESRRSPSSTTNEGTVLD